MLSRTPYTEVCDVVYLSAGVYGCYSGRGWGCIFSKGVLKCIQRQNLDYNTFVIYTYWIYSNVGNLLDPFYRFARLICINRRGPGTNYGNSPTGAWRGNTVSKNVSRNEMQWKKRRRDRKSCLMTTSFDVIVRIYFIILTYSAIS